MSQKWIKKRLTLHLSILFCNIKSVKLQTNPNKNLLDENGETEFFIALTGDKLTGLFDRQNFKYIKLEYLFPNLKDPVSKKFEI